MQALGWVRCSMRLERLQETKGVSDVVIYVELKEVTTGTRSGVRSLISTSLLMLDGIVAGLGADVGVADCCCMAG